MVYDLRHADTRLRWLVTCLLGTFGVARFRGYVAHEARGPGIRAGDARRRLGDGARLRNRHCPRHVADVDTEERSCRMISKFLAAMAVAAVLHITPTVVLVQRPDAVKALLPGAEAFFAREVHLSNTDAHRLHEAVDWSPEDGVLTFYTGKTADRVAGALVFVRVDTPHGPIEVAVGFTPAGAIGGVVVTKATVETKPWVLEALRAGLVDGYKGLKPGNTPAGAAALKDRIGALPAYMAGRGEALRHDVRDAGQRRRAVRGSQHRQSRDRLHAERDGAGGDGRDQRLIRR